MGKIAKVKNKIIITGDIIEVFEYSEGYSKGYSLNSADRSKKGRKKDYTSQEYRDNREKVLNRARSDLRRIINSNANQYGKEYTTKFLTLTFRENIKDLKMANYEWKKFIQRLNYEVYNTKKSVIKYSVVPEFQKRGAVHYHVVFYNLPYLKADLVSEIWGNGFIKINKIDNVDNLGAYVCKYMTKDNSDERLEGNKCDSNARGLYKPIEYTDLEDKKIIESLTDSLLLKNLKHRSVFENEYLGDITYYQFNINYNDDAISSILPNATLKDYNAK